MGVLSRFADRLTLVAIRGVLREIRSLRETLRVGVDSYRVVNGLPPAFTSELPVGEGEGEGLPRGSVIAPGDFQTVWMIEELCRERHIPLTVDTDLEQVALAQGWVSPEGTLLVWPESARGLEVDR